MPRKSGLIIKAFSKYVLHLYYGHSLAHADVFVILVIYCKADSYYFFCIGSSQSHKNANIFPGTA